MHAGMACQHGRTIPVGVVKLLPLSVRSMHGYLHVNTLIAHKIAKWSKLDNRTTNKLIRYFALADPACRVAREAGINRHSADRLNGVIRRCLVWSTAACRRFVGIYLRALWQGKPSPYTGVGEQVWHCMFGGTHDGNPRKSWIGATGLRL